ncbi:MAG: serine hydrolase [Dehalococcoidia bacterium]
MERPRRRLTGRSLIAACLLCAAALLLACGGGDSAPEATPSTTALVTPTSTPLPPAPIVTPVESSTPAPTDAASIKPPEPVCPDPYPGGAPFEPDPGEPLQIRWKGPSPALLPYQPLPFTKDQQLDQIVRRTIGQQELPHVAVVVKNLADGHGVMIAPDREFYSASLFKTWVLLEVFHQRDAGTLDFTERYIVSDYYVQRGINPGEIAACSQVTVGQAVQSMIRISDNTAANLLLDRVGPGNVEVALQSLGLTVTQFAGGGSLPTNAREMALLLEAIGRRKAVSTAASNQMIGLLATESFADRILAGVPPGTKVAHKTGNWSNATHDVGIVFSPAATYAIAVLTDYGFDDDGATPIARISRAVYDYYNRP